MWSERSLELEKEQNNIECVEQEKKAVLFGEKLNYVIDDKIYARLRNIGGDFKRRFDNFGKRI